jgi:hypothetical protein
VYRTILLFLTGLALKVAWLPLGTVAVTALVTGLREWFRKSELSADRAGLLVGQDVQASMRGLMKIAGGNHLHEMNVDAFLKQADEYEASGDLRDSVLKILNVLPRSHPFTTVRAAELRRWAASRDFQRLMDGHYPKRTADKDASVADAFRESASHYSESVKRSKDPLMGLIRDITNGAGDVGGRLRNRFTGNGSSGSSDSPGSSGSSSTSGSAQATAAPPNGPAADSGSGPEDDQPGSPAR